MKVIHPRDIALAFIVIVLVVILLNQKLILGQQSVIIELLLSH